MATDEKKEPVRRRRAAAAEGDDAAKKPARAPRAKKPARAKSADAAQAGDVAEAAAAPGVDVAGGGDVQAAPVAEVVGVPTADASGGAEAGAGVTATAEAPEAVLTHDEVRTVVGELLRLSGMEAGLELKDAEDGSIAVAVNFDPVPAGIQPGRRTPLMDSLQFLTNKLVNRPGSTSRRWVALGALGFPAPRPAPGTRPAKEKPALQAPVAEAAAKAAPVAKAAPSPQAARPQREAPAARTDERSLSVTEDPSLAEASVRLSERSAKLGRYYVLFPMGEEDRARVVQAAAGTPGVRVSCEGEGRHRRVVFKPDAPTPLPKQTLPDYDDEDEDEGDAA